MTTPRSSIDLGTNTCLLLLADWAPGCPEPTRVIGDFATVVRLGQGVDRTRKLDSAAMERTLACLRGYADRVREAGANPAETQAVATSQARDAINGSEFFERVARETGFRFRVLSGDDEAGLTFQGALLPGMSPERTAVIDIGGGSTEWVMSSRGGSGVDGLSLDIGSVRFTERFLKTVSPDEPVTDEQFWACQEAVDSALERALAWRGRLPVSGTGLLAVAGTATTLAAWHLGLARFDAAAIDGTTLTRGDVHRLVEELKWRSPRERETLPGVEAGRADVLLAGALILWRGMERLSFPECRISTRGLRYGVLKAP